MAALETVARNRRVREQATSTTPSETEIPIAQHVQNAESAATTSLTPSTARRLQRVSTLADRSKIVKWMNDTVAVEGDKRIASKAVTNFPLLFRGTRNANLVRASRLWRSRSDFTDANGEVVCRGKTTSITRVSSNGLKRVHIKARAGRGRKRAHWVLALHRDLLDEFDRLRKLGVKFNLQNLRALAVHLAEQSCTPAYSRNFVDPRTELPILMSISARWIQSFADRFRIVSRAHTGKLLTSPAKEAFIEKEVAFHLGNLCRQFTSSELQEDDVENADETHFVINYDNGRTLGFMGDEEVKYADVVPGGEGMTMVVRLSGGSKAIIENPFMVFKNQSRSYPIRGVPDNVPGVAYRSGPKGWMDTQVMPQWLEENRVISTLPNNRKRILYVDNCSGHNNTGVLNDATLGIKTEIRYFPKNATHLIQPCDSFVIQKIKRAWCTRWERYKMEMIMKEQWTDGSGKLVNPGKLFFLRLAAASVRDVNEQRDKDGLTFARKAMVRTGMALNTNGEWEERQLFPKLQNVVNRYRNHFNGEPVHVLSEYEEEA